MSIRDCSGLPDDQVPAWVRRAREEERARQLAYNRRLCRCQQHFASRGALLAHTDKTGHFPLLFQPDDRFLKRPET